MAKLLLINDNTHLTANNINDVVAVYSDDQELGKREQEQVDSGLFKLILLPEKTVEDIHAEIQAEHPSIKQMWYDKATLEWKELAKTPKAAMRYVDSTFRHNFSIPTGNEKLCNDEKIKILEAELKVEKEKL